MARRKADLAPVIKIVTVRGKPDAKMLRRIQQAAQIMVKKSWERGQAWKRTGMYGAFLEIYNCYMRLATLMTDEYDVTLTKEVWQSEIDNVCNDIRNFTTLLQLAMDAGKFNSDYIPPKPKIRRIPKLKGGAGEPCDHVHGDYCSSCHERSK